MLPVMLRRHAECRYADRRYADCRGAASKVGREKKSARRRRRFIYFFLPKKDYFISAAFQSAKARPNLRPRRRPTFFPSVSKLVGRAARRSPFYISNYKRAPLCWS